MMLEGNRRTLLVLSGGFLEEGGDGGQCKMHVPKLVCGRTNTGGGLCVTGCIINGNVWLYGQRGRRGWAHG